LCCCRPPRRRGRNRHGWTRQSICSSSSRRPAKGEFIAFINAAGSAYSWVNAELGIKDAGQRLFCPPPGKSLTSRDYAHIAVAEYRKSKQAYAQRIEYPLDVLSLALLRGLQDTFPCK